MSGDITATTQLAQVPALLIAGGHLHLAEQLYREALEAWEVHGGRPSTKAATFLNNLAHIIGELGKVDEAEALYRRAIEMWTLDEGGEGLVATGLNNLAGLLKYKGELKEAHELYEKALDMDEKLWGSSHPDVATDLNNFASLLKVEGALDESFAYFDRAVTIYEMSFANNRKDAAAGLIHPWLAVSLNNLGELCRYRGDLPRAEVCLKRAVDIFEKAGTVSGGSGTDRSSSSLATSVHNLARCYQDQQRYAEAEAEYKRALALLAEGSASPGKEAGRDPAALAVAALDGPEKDMRTTTMRGEGNKGDNMQSVRSNGLAFASGLNNLGSLKHALGDEEAARRLYEQSIRLREELHGTNHLCNLTALNNNSRLSHDQGNIREAEHLQRKCMDVYRSFSSDGYGTNVTQAATCMNNLASVLQDAEFYGSRSAEGNGAMSLYRRAIALLEGGGAKSGTLEQQAASKRKQEKGEDEPNLSGDAATALNNLGSLLAQNGRLEEAKDAFERSHRMLVGIDQQLKHRLQNLVKGERGVLTARRSSSVDHPRMVKTRMNLILVLWRLGQFDEALQLIESARATRTSEKKINAPGHDQSPITDPAPSSKYGDAEHNAASTTSSASHSTSPGRSEAIIANLLRSRLPYPY
jgi:tetratricopeptide (TPR) repeat protein